MHGDQLLIDDHNVLRHLLSQLERHDVTVTERRSYLKTLVEEIAVHTQIEDELFYPAVFQVSPLVAVSHAEHRQIDDQLAAVVRTDLDSAAFDVEVAGLKAVLDHHAGEEESDMFPQAQALGASALEDLGRRMQARKDDLRRSTLVSLRLRVKRGALRLTGTARRSPQSS